MDARCAHLGPSSVEHTSAEADINSATTETLNTGPNLRYFTGECKLLIRVALESLVIFSETCLRRSARNKNERQEDERAHVCRCALSTLSRFVALDVVKLPPLPLK